MNIGDVFKGKSRKYNQYYETECTEGRKCRNCMRWRYSFPYTCSDCEMVGNKAETCLNYTEDKNAPVD